jgi:hypothetical protein
MRVRHLRPTGKRSPWVPLLAVMVLANSLHFAGCEGSSTSPTATVSGLVTLAGKPLTAGTVLFITDEGQAASAELAPDGTYTLHCSPGRYKITVTPPAPLDPLSSPAGVPPPAASNQPAIPKRYQDFGGSGLSLEVKAGANKFDIALVR